MRYITAQLSEDVTFQNTKKLANNSLPAAAAVCAEKADKGFRRSLTETVFE